MELVFVLSHPSVSANIGAAARALKTMGFGRLRLVAPADHLGTEARKLAHGAADVLERAELFPTTEAALAGMDMVVGTTARPRNIRQDYLPVRELRPFLTHRREVVRRVALLFGNESSGLSNEEIALCDILSYIPLATSFPSLNLAQAVMLYAYELAELPAPSPTSPQREKSAYRVLRDRATRLLPLLGIHPARPVYHRIFERLALAGPDDIHLLLSVTDAVLKKLETKE